jgi:hypothetical protein
MTDSRMSWVMFPVVQRISKYIWLVFYLFLQFLTVAYIGICTVYVVYMICEKWACNVSCVKEMCDMTCVHVRTM